MKKFNKIAVINELNLPAFAEVEIQHCASQVVDFSSGDSPSEDISIQRIGDAEAVLGSWNCHITTKILDACPNLQYIGICGTSLTKVDTEAIKSRSIVLKNVVDYGDEATGEFIFAQLLNLFRGFGKYQWQSLPSELNGKTIGIVGLGAVGKQVARIAQGFNMQVIYYSRTRNQEWEKKGLVYTSLDSLLSSSDIICLCVPRNLCILGAKEFSRIKDRAVLVNTSIGSVFKIPDFITWISKENNYAIIDNQEYINEIIDLPNVIALPITAGKTQESINRLGIKVVSNIKSYLANKE